MKGTKVEKAGHGHYTCSCGVEIGIGYLHNGEIYCCGCERDFKSRALRTANGNLRRKAKSRGLLVLGTIHI